MGEPLVLRPFQKEALRHIFARRPDGKRRHRTAIYATARKNGKTELAAAIALFTLTMGGRGIQVISAANDREQANLVFSAAKRMVDLSPDLSATLKSYRHAIEDTTTGSVYRVISAEAFTKEGLSPTLVIYDELHAAPTRELYDVLNLAMGTSIDPLMLVVTTAGAMSSTKEDETVLYTLKQYGERVCTGEVDDPRFFMAWWEPEDPEADPLDRTVWAAANPGLGDILDEEDMVAQQPPKTPEQEFRTKRLNTFTPVEDFWLPFGEWEKCQVGEHDPVARLHDLDAKLPVAVGTDVAIYHDASAVYVAQQQGERVVVRGRVWENPHQPGTVMHSDWRMPRDEIKQYLRELRKLFPVPAVKIDDRAVPGPAYVYDKYGLAGTELDLELEGGFALIPINQQSGWMVEASRRFYEAVIEHRIAHDGDPTLAAHLRNVVPRQVGESGWRLEKASRNRKIDAAVAAVMAVSQVLEEAPRRRFSAFAA